MTRICLVDTLKSMHEWKEASFHISFFLKVLLMKFWKLVIRSVHDFCYILSRLKQHFPICLLSFREFLLEASWHIVA